MKSLRWVVLAFFAASALRTGVQPAEADEGTEAIIRELKNQIRGLDHKLRSLERKQELEKRESAAKAQAAPVVTAGASGFSIRSADTNFLLRLRGGLQTDGRFYPGGSAANDTFLLRRVRPILEGTVYGKFDYRVMFDFASGVSLAANNNGSVLDAYADSRLWPAVSVRVGKFKEPVGLERLQSWSNLQFVERGFPTQLLPNRDVGLMVHGELLHGCLNYQLGAFNGTPDGGSNDFDASDSDKDFAARLFAHPFRTSEWAALRGLGLGISGTVGEQSRTPRSYSTPGSQRFFSYRSGTGGEPNVLGDGTQWRLSPQGYWYWGPFGLLGEYAISSQEVRLVGGRVGAGVGTDLRNIAWQIGLSFFVTGEENSFRPVSPRRPFTLGGEGWGALELTARVGELNPDDDTFPIFADPRSSAAKARSWGGGFNWHLNRFFKLTLNYEQANLNAANLGYSGLEQEHVVLTRLQITY